MRVHFPELYEAHRLRTEPFLRRMATSLGLTYEQVIEGVPKDMASPRGRKPKTNEQAEQLTKALDFVKGAATNDETFPQGGFVILKGQMAAVYTRQVSAGFPIVEELDLAVDLSRLRTALDKCGKSLTMTVTGAGSLSIVGDKLRAVVPSWKEPIYEIEPEQPVAVINDNIKEAFKTCMKLSSEAGETVVEASLLLQANSCTGTNRVAMLQYWHGIDLPPHIVVPKAFARAVVATDIPLTGFGFAWDDDLGKPSAVTFWFEGGSWIRTQCYFDRWGVEPDDILNAAVTPEPTPSGFFEGCEAVAKFSDDETASIYFATDKIMSHIVDAKGAQYEVKGLVPGKRFDASLMKVIAPFAEKIDVKSYPDKLFFYTDKLPIRGVVMGMTGGIQSGPEPQAETIVDPWANIQKKSEQYNSDIDDDVPLPERF